MANNEYNIFAKLQANIEDFDNNGVYIVGKPTVSENISKKQRGKRGGYYYSQRDLNEALDLAIASRFKKGTHDAEGKRKMFMNIVNFHKDVALNQINVNVSNYILEPTNLDYSWPVFFMDQKFTEWADENSFDDTIDELADDFVGKGSCVIKRIKNTDVLERVPLRTLRNTQTARSLESAARNGGYVIIENEMHYNEMEKYPDWDIEDLDSDKIYTVYERYALTPAALVKQFNGEEPTDEDWSKMILTMQVLLPESKSKDDENVGTILYIEKIKDGDFPLEEAHYRHIDGRWQGEGEVEKQLDNQIAKNTVANLRLRGLVWAVKKIFQSTDDEVASNLLMEVSDGAVLRVKPNGTISQVNTQSQHSGDLQQYENSVDANAQKISFSFESASGESMPSGTPFRLGAVLGAAVSKYFKRKQDTFSNFLKRSFFDQLIPMFKEENKEEHSIRYSVSQDNYEQVLEAMVIVHTNNYIKEQWKNRNYIAYDQAKEVIKKELMKQPYLFAEIPKDYYDDAHCYMRLNINEPIGADIESLTTVWQGLVAKGDPRADRVLKMILSKKGKNLDYILGGAIPTAQPTASGEPAPQQPNTPAVPVTA